MGEGQHVKQNSARLLGGCLMVHPWRIKGGKGVYPLVLCHLDTSQGHLRQGTSTEETPLKDQTIGKPKGHFLN